MLPASGYRTMPWKNGGGLTHEIAVDPPDAGIDGRPFDWRLSLAELADHNDFSRFPGIDRTLVLLSGGPMTLHIDATPPRRLQPLDTVVFRGESAVRCTLDGSGARDLNVMVARGRLRADVEVLRLQPGARHAHDVDSAAVVLVYVATGLLAVKVEGDAEGMEAAAHVAAHGTWRCDAPTRRIALQAVQDSVAIVAVLSPVGRHADAQLDASPRSPRSTRSTRSTKGRA
ncbi:MAG: HutD family protein [Casimicrobiaceae bacterium]